MSLITTVLANPSPRYVAVPHPRPELESWAIWDPVMEQFVEGDGGIPALTQDECNRAIARIEKVSRERLCDLHYDGCVMIGAHRMMVRPGDIMLGRNICGICAIRANVIEARCGICLGKMTIVDPADRKPAHYACNSRPCIRYGRL